jgi:hypothetical protein
VGRSVHSADAGSLRQKLTQVRRSGRAVPRLVKFLVLLLLSLGVWGLIWAAFSLLRSALL